MPDLAILGVVIPVNTPPVVVNTATFDVPATSKLMLPPEVPMLPSDVPLTNLVTLTPRLSPVSCEPLPMKNVPATLPALVMLPDALTKPTVRILPPTTLAVEVIVPEAVTKPAVTMLPPVMLPVATTCAPVFKLPPVILPVTLSVVPTVAALLTANVPEAPRA